MSRSTNTRYPFGLNPPIRIRPRARSFSKPGGTGSGHSLYLLNGELIGGSWDTVTTVDWSFLQGPTVTSGVWHHAVLSVENNVKTVWYDGQIVATGYGFSYLSEFNGDGIGAIRLSTLIDENFNDNSASLLSSANGSRRFTGSLDRLTLHTRALSAADVQVLYEAKPEPRTRHHSNYDSAQSHHHRQPRDRLVQRDRQQSVDH